MTVYIVVRNITYVGTTIEKVFSTYEAAERYNNSITYPKGEYDIEERYMND